MSIHYRLFFLLAFFACLSCENSTSPKLGYIGKIDTSVPSISIEGSTVVIRATSNAPMLTWKSSLIGVLGNGSLLKTSLPVGDHYITLEYESCVLDSCSIRVKSLTYTEGSYFAVGLQSNLNKILLPAGCFSPLCISIGNSNSSLHLHAPSPVLRARSIVNTESRLSFFEKKMFNSMADFNVSNEPLTRVPVNAFTLGRNVQSKQLELSIGSSRQFIIADTSGIIANGIELNAQLVFSGTLLNIWVDEDVFVTEEDLSEFTKQAEGFILSRLFALWGRAWADIDSDGKIAILITQLINDQGKAIGFFNPNDFYKKNIDISSNLYNPISNEMDIVYLANPFGHTDDFAYSLSSVLATFAHETYHLLMYSRKPFLAEQAGDLAAVKEELFLDEGLAHLTESLVGFGVSGGNIAFFSRYLENTANISARYVDIDGQSDSVGKRGMVSAFLSWLFWREGGAEWDIDNPGIITDRGGLRFLSRLLNTSKTGWENISSAVGLSADTLLVEWFEEIEIQDRYPALRDALIIDPITNEIISLSPFAGTVFLGTNQFVLDGPVRYDLSTHTQLAPYSVVFGRELQMIQKDYLSFTCKADDTLANLRFYMY